MSGSARNPKRIQRRRTKGWRLPLGAVIVSRPSKWGNPFRGLNAAEQYRKTLDMMGQQQLDLFLEPLVGRDLVCWCALVDKDGNPVPCHADVLLELANGAG